MSDAVVDVVAKVRENVVLRRSARLSVPSGNGFLATYVVEVGNCRSIAHPSTLPGMWHT